MPNPGMELGSHSSRSIRIGKESRSNSPVLFILIIHSVCEVPLVHVQVPEAEKVTRGERDPDRGRVQAEGSEAAEAARQAEIVTEVDRLLIRSCGGSRAVVDHVMTLNVKSLGSLRHHVSP